MKKDIRFLVTNKCNYDCYFCHNEGITKVTERADLSVEDYLVLYKMYLELTGSNGVTISGGEPLLYRHIKELVKLLHENGAKITLVTNGFLLIENLDILKYIDRINVSIHTIDEKQYEKIVGRTNALLKVQEGLVLAREIYPDLKIRLNITPTRSNNWSSNFLNDLIEYAKTIQASIKFTELFPPKNSDCVTVQEIQEELKKLGYMDIPSEERTIHFQNGDMSIYLTQCTCSKASKKTSPISYCRQYHELYVNHTGKFMLCRLSNDSLDFLEEIKEGNYDILRKKMEIAQRRITSQQCNQYLLINM